MRSIFEVTGPNSGTLLTLAEAKAALGITDTTRDADVSRLVAKISAGIFRACNLRTDGISPPTLLSEELTDSFWFSGTTNLLQLSRRRVTEVAALTEAGAELAEDVDYEIDRAAGHILRLDSANGFTWWPAGRITIDYVAGFETVPDDLKLAAETWLRTLWSSSYETPATVTSAATLRSEEIPGVLSRTWWVEGMGRSSTAAAPTLVPPEVESILVNGGYVEHWIA
jgi:hypothetical protein